MWRCCLNNNLNISKHQRLKEKPFNFKTSLKLSSSQGSVQATERGLGENVRGPPSCREKISYWCLSSFSLSAPQITPKLDGVTGSSFCSKLFGRRKWTMGNNLVSGKSRELRRSPKKLIPQQLLPDAWASTEQTGDNNPPATPTSGGWLMSRDTEAPSWGPASHGGILTMESYVGAPRAGDGSTSAASTAPGTREGAGVTQGQPAP